MAIIVGGRTVVDDDPSLTTRLFPGPNPRAVVIDPRNRVRGTERLFNGVGERPLLFAGSERPAINAEVIVMGSELNKAALTQVLGELKSRRYGEVTVEGGAALLNAFIEAGLWEEARVFTGSIRFGTGVKAPLLPPNSERVLREDVRGDLLRVYRNG